MLWGLTGKDAGENHSVENQDVTRKLQEVVALCDLIVGTEEVYILGRRHHRGPPRHPGQRSRRPAGLQARPRRCVAFPAFPTVWTRASLPPAS
ncbi:hypothetical protein ACRAWD_20080 [Caulobacter segnis]